MTDKLTTKQAIERVLAGRRKPMRVSGDHRGRRPDLPPRGEKAGAGRLLRPVRGGETPGRARRPDR